jgi:hypothetical protein
MPNHATTKYNLQVNNHVLANEWNRIKNNNLTPRNVTPHSQKKVWWQCSKGHEWLATVANRSNGSNCPFCSGNKVNDENCLQTVNQKLANEWHPTKNGTITPIDVTACSGKKVWWLCSKGHEWVSVVSNRNNGSGCPFCSGSKVNDENCLQTINSVLAREWHPTKNDGLSPKDITAGSKKKVWWQCSKGHEWNTTVNNRNNRQGCPYCVNRKVNDENCLQTINPSLAKEWHPSRNRNLAQTDVTAFSNNRVWWQCSKGHEWEARVSERSNGNGCPYCSNKKVNDENCLQTINPSLAKEWHPTKNDSLTPEDVTVGSKKKAWWQCSKGHEWNTTVKNRNNGQGCPYCANKKVNDENCLQTINPSLAKEWHPTNTTTIHNEINN